jgi:hypothetical protein
MQERDQGIYLSDFDPAPDGVYQWGADEIRI